jgi:peroxiredoxin
MADGLTKVKAREINETIRYTTWTTFHINERVLDSTSASKEFDNWLADLANSDIKLRGTYNCSGMRADADFILWLHAPQAELIQEALLKFRRTALGKASDAVWSVMGLHRPAEFNKGHVPAFMAGAPAKDWLCVYPFVRSYEWYLLPEEERRSMLMEHGMAGRDFGGIISNTVSAFALGDYEWILALESDELHEIVDMMRTLRNTQARLHVREEIPFYTGHSCSSQELAGMFA